MKQRNSFSKTINNSNMISRKVLIAIAFFSVILFSCNGKTKSKPFQDVKPGQDVAAANKTVESSAKTVKEVGEEIRLDATVVQREAGEVEEIVPDEVKPVVEPHVAVIRDRTGNIIKKTTELEDVAENLGAASHQLLGVQSKLKTLQSEYDRSKKTTAKAIEERDAAIKREKDAIKSMLTWLIAACVIAFGLSVALMFFGHFATGAPIALGTAATLVLAIAVRQYLAWIALGGLAIIAAGGVFFIYQFFVRQKAFEETVETTEIAKERLSANDRKDVFGEGVEPGLAYQIQSSSTEKLVDQVRRRMKPHWEHTVQV